MEVVELLNVVQKGGAEGNKPYFIKTYSHKMLGICFLFYTDRQIAQDLMHDGFIYNLALSSLGSFASSGKAENR